MANDAVKIKLVTGESDANKQQITVCPGCVSAGCGMSASLQVQGEPASSIRESFNGKLSDKIWVTLNLDQMMMIRGRT